MEEAKSGDTVRVHYRGSLEDGTVFDSSYGKDPFELALGSSQAIAGFEAGVLGMVVAETKKIVIEPKEAYGEPLAELIISIERSRLPKDVIPKPGMMLNLTTDQGKSTSVMVSSVKNDTVVLDANHPLAGRRLIFEIELLEIL